MQPRFTQEERDAMMRSFLSVDKEVLFQAETVASLLSEDEEEPQDALLALKFFYCRPENKKMLDEMLDRLSIDKF